MKRVKFLDNCSVFVLFLLCLSVWCNGEDESVSSPMEKTEQEALYSTIQGFVGKWWNGSDLYPDPCGWTPIEGVSCDLFDGFWYVTDLSIGPVHDNSLICAQKVQFSPHLFALRHLKSLSFFNCFVSPKFNSVSIPTQNWEVFSQSLISLEFRSNHGLTGQIPFNFGALKNLESLVLVENGLTGEIPTSIGSLTNLKRLNLAGNGFVGKIPDNLRGLNRLLILDISRNSLSGPLSLTFGGLTSVLKVDLSSNKLEGKIPESIRNLAKLTLLDLRNNNFSGGLTKSIQELSNLEELVLSNNPLGGDLMSLDWRNLAGLTALDLSNTLLTGGVPESFGELKGLRFLGLNDNKLTGDIPQSIQILPNVSAIYVHGNNLSGELRFSKGFYKKMGRRFGAWDNPYLCYPMGLISYVPFGIKQCEGQVANETRLVTVSNSADGIRNQDSNHLVSLGFSACRVNALVFVMLILVVLIFNVFFY